MSLAAADVDTARNGQFLGDFELLFSALPQQPLQVSQPSFCLSQFTPS